MQLGCVRCGPAGGGGRMPVRLQILSRTTDSGAAAVVAAGIVSGAWQDRGVAAKAAKKSEATGTEAVEGGRPRLLLMDGHSMAYRAFFALPVENFTTATGQPTNAIYGFASMLANTLRDEAPTHFAVAFDVSRKTWRSEEFPDYKANRSKTPDEFRGQVELIGEMLDAMHVKRFAVEGFEADDVIATLATQATAQGFEVSIVTGDRDSFQLVTDDVTVLYPTKGVSELTRFTPEKVQEKYGLTPAQYPDFAALRGDRPTTCPASPASARRPPRSGSTSSVRSRSWWSAPRRSRARPGRISATTWRRSSSTAS